MLTIAISTFKEAYRKKIFNIVGVLTIIYIIMLGIVLILTNKFCLTQGDIVSNFIQFAGIISFLGFNSANMLTMLLTIMLSIGMVSSEIEDGTILSILTKPIKRSDYILGKYLGMAALIILYSIILYVSIIIISALAHMSLLERFGFLRLFKGFLYFILESLTILSLSLFGGVVFKTTGNGVFVVSIYILGVIGSIMEQIASLINYSILSTIGIFTSLVSPFDIIYRKMITTIFSILGQYNAFTGFERTSKSTNPSMWMMVYVIIYLFLFILAATKKFQRKDI